MKLPDLSFHACEKKKTLLSVGAGVEIPVWIVCGKNPGPTLVVTAGVHGCEFVGIQAVQQLYQTITPETFLGQLILLPLVNEQGFYQGKKQLVPQDGKNLNRIFPGDPWGTLSQKIAFEIEKKIYPAADFLVDFHGGDSNEALTPMVFFPTAASPAVAMQARSAAMHLPVAYRVPSTATNGLYSYAAKCGIPALLLEIGGGGTWSEEEVRLGQSCLAQLMSYLNMCGTAHKNPAQWEGVEAVYEEAGTDGFWFPCISPNQTVKAGDPLGYLENLDGDLICEYIAKQKGVIWYHTTALGVQKGDPLVAYGSL